MLLISSCLCLTILLEGFVSVSSRVVYDNEFVQRNSQSDLYEDSLYDDERLGESFMQGDQPWQQEQEPDTKSDHEVTRRPFRECTSPDDCFPDECCQIGMQRYSIPSCQRMGIEGDYCRHGQEPVNTTLYYPNGVKKDVTEGHILFCPCTQGLECTRAICRPSGEARLVQRSHGNPL